jgi:hypothetical protein
MSVPLPADFLKSAWHKIPPVVKAAFISALAIGLITHSFMFTNKLPNHDELAQMVGQFNHANLGRWFLQYPLRISGIFSMPWVNGLLSVLYLSVAAGLVVHTIKIKNAVFAAMVAALVVTMPTVAGTMTYMMMADPFFFALMLACLGAFLAERCKWGFVFAVVPIVLSLGIYQSYFGLAAGLMMLVLINNALKTNSTWDDLLIKGVKFAVALAVSMVMYLIIVQLAAPPEGLTDYQGVNQMGRIPLSQIPGDILTAYLRMASFFLTDSRNFHYSFMSYVFIFSGVMCAVLLILWCRWKKIYKSLAKTLVLVFLLILFPLALNIVYLMDAAIVHDLMIYPTVLVLVFLLLTVDMMCGEKIFPFTKKTAVCCWAVTLAVFLCIFNYWITSNQVYFKLYMGYQQTFAQSTILMSRIHGLEEFTVTTEIVLVGTPRLPDGIPQMQYISVTGSRGISLFGAWSYPLFLRRFMNVTQPVRYIRDAVVDDGEIAQILAEMPLYPDYGAVRYIDGRVYVNFARPR